MKTIITILILFLPLCSGAYWNTGFTDYSVFAGKQYRFAERLYTSYEFYYDRKNGGCLTQPVYYGFGLVYNHSSNNSEIGLKAAWNPGLFYINISRKSRFYPYLFVQGNRLRTSSQDPATSEKILTTSYSIRPGLGITGRVRIIPFLHARTSLQIGYCFGISDNSPQFKSPWVLEYKMGFGISGFVVKKLLKRSKK